MANQHIAAREDEPLYEDQFMYILKNEPKATEKWLVDIPKDLLDLAHKTTSVYKEFTRIDVPMESLKPSGPTPGTHRKSRAKVEPSRRSYQSMVKAINILFTNEE